MRAPESLQDLIWIQRFDHPMADPVLEQVRRDTIARIVDRHEWPGTPVERVRVILNGIEVPREAWRRIKPKAGASLVLVRVPGAAAVPAIATFFLGLVKTIGAGFGLAAVPTGPGFALNAGIAVGKLVVSVAISQVISAGIGALTSQPSSDASSDAGGKPSPTLQGTGNVVRPNDVYPYVAGRFRIQPPLGSFPFTTVRGGESVLSALFIVGRGDHEILPADVMIGEIPVSQFDRARIAIRSGTGSDPNLSLFTDRVIQVALSNVFDVLTTDDPTLRSPWVQARAAGEGHAKIGFDFSFPQGLGVFTSRSGALRMYFFGMEIQYRVNGGSWISVITLPSLTPLTGENVPILVAGTWLLQFKGDSGKPFQAGFTFDLDIGPMDVVDVQMRRVEFISRANLPGGGNSSGTIGQLVWFALKGFNFRSPPLDLTETPLSTIELEVPLDEQFAGLQNNFSVIAHRKCRIHNPGDAGGTDADGWTTVKYATSNPAALIRDMLQGTNNRRPVPDSRINVTSMSDFYDFCADHNDNGSGPLRFDFVFDTRTSLIEACNTAAAAGKGRFGQDSRGRFSVVIDRLQTGLPKGLISAANARAFSLLFSYPREAHAIRARFVDETSGFDPDSQMIVYEDGFSADGSGGTQVADDSTFLTQDFPGVTQPGLIFALARYTLAVRKQRPQVYEVEMGIENLAYQVGEVALFSHPGALLGAAWGRLKAVTSAVFRESFESELPTWSDTLLDITGSSATKFRDSSNSVAHGDGALRVVSSSAAAIVIVQHLSLPLSWTACEIGLHAQIPAGSISGTDGVRIRVYGPTTGDWAEYRFGTADGLVAGALSSISVSLADPPDASLGTFNAAVVIRWEIQLNVVSGAAARIFRIDNFRVTREDGNLAEIELESVEPLVAGTGYALDYRRELSSPIGNEARRVSLRSLSSFGVTTDRLSRILYLESPIPAATVEPLMGSLYAFGSASAVTSRVIVRDKTPGPDLTARLTLVDEAPAVHDATGPIPPFAPSSSLPVSIRLLGPATPTIRAIVADERALTLSMDGTLRPRILIHLIPGTDVGRPRADFWSVKYKKIAPDMLPAVSLPFVAATSHEIVIDGVDELATYKVFIQAVNNAGRTSATVIDTVVVTGKTNPPPDVQGFRLEGSLLRWTLDGLPIDLAGFEIRRGPLGGTFDNATSIHAPMLVSAPPFDISMQDGGFGVLYIIALDRVGNQSVTPAMISGLLGAAPEQNIVDTIDLHALGFPIVDQIDSVLDGFENLVPKETPDDSLELMGIEDDTDIASVVGTDTTVSVTMANPYAGLQALSLVDDSGTGSVVKLTYRASITRENSVLSLRLRGGKAATFAAALRIIDPEDPDKWSRYDVGGIAGLAYGLASANLAAAPTAVGSSGAADVRDFLSLEIKVTNSAPVAGDSCLIDDLVWTGGAVNGVLVESPSGDLVTMERGAEFWPEDDDAPFWPEDDAAEFWDTAEYLPGFYQFVITPTAASVPSSLRIIVNSDVGVAHRIFYRTESSLFWDGSDAAEFWDGPDDAPFWPTLTDRFVEFPGVLENIAVQEYEFLIQLDGGPVQGRVTQLEVILDVPDEEEKLSQIVVASSGTFRIPITKSYRSIRTVLLTIMEDGNGGVTAKVLDMSTDGPSLRVDNVAGTRVTGLVNAFVEGVRA